MDNYISFSGISSFEALFWDFDGVLMDSNSIRDFGFIEVLKDFPESMVEKLVSYHQANGGLSRYHKFRYFYEEILKEPVTEEVVNNLAGKFSLIMRNKLLDSKLLITETLSFIQRNFTLIPMFVVSGSDQQELRILCEEHKINRYFKGIFGSPTPKNELVKNILDSFHFHPASCLMIGDSINDFNAAHINGLHFMGYNNNRIIDLSTAKIDFQA